MKQRWYRDPKILEIFEKAAEMARKDNCDEVTEWHILLSLLRFDSVWQLFSSPDRLKERLHAETQELSLQHRGSGKRPRLRPQLFASLILSANRLFREEEIALPRPDHLVQALYQAGSPLLRNILQSHDYTEQASVPEESVQIPNRHLPESADKALKQFTVELVSLAEKHPTQVVCGRRAETDILLRSLARRKKCCPVLVGQPGVGKTAVVEALACRIAAGDVPPAFRSTKIYSLNTGNLIAGASYRGQYEGRLRTVINAVRQDPDAVLFVDELHALLTSGTNTGDALTAGNILKPELASGALRFIGATTADEYRKFIEADGAMERRFIPITVLEPTREACLEMLQNSRPALEEHYHVVFPDSILRSALDLACAFLPQRHLPDKVFDVLDEAGAELLLRGENPGTELTQENLESVVARMAGLPHLPHAAADRFAPLRRLESELKATIFGQDAAIEVLCRAVKLAESGFSSFRSGTRGAFFFNGSTGVGKTELARCLARTLGIPLVKFDMTEYADESTASRLIGAAPGLVGCEDGGLLVNAIRENPHCVLLLDEIEKAHRRIHQLLLQVMDGGTLTDSRGRTADCRQLYLIMTGNVKTGGVAPLGFGGTEEKRPEKPDLTKQFAPEFRSRLTAAVSFAPLSSENLGKIVDAKFELLQRKAREHGFTVTLDSTARRELVRRTAERNEGARPIATLLEEFAALPLAELLIDNAAARKRTLVFSGGEFSCAEIGG